MTRRPAVSVALATHNGARYVGDQLASIVDQEWRPDEVVIADDASTDATVEVVMHFAATAPFAVEVLRSDHPLGLVANFERAITRCHGEVILLADQDDRWHPAKIATLASLFAADAPPALAFSDLRLVDDTGADLGTTQWQRLGFGPRLQRALRREPLDVLLRFNVVTGAAAAFHASLRTVALPLPPEWIHDEWLALMAAATGRVAFVARPLVDYRQHAGQQVGAAVSGWRGRLDHARRNIDAAYMDRAAVRSEIAASRLEAHRDRLREPRVITRLRARQAHYERRHRIRGAGLDRIGAVATEWARGRYRRFGYGTSAALFDLLVPDRRH